MMRLINKLLPSCQEVSRLTSQAMDESLPLRKRLGLRLHIRMCIWCRRNAQQLRLVRRLACGHDLSTSDQASLSTEAQRRITDSLNKADDRS